MYEVSNFSNFENVGVGWQPVHLGHRNKLAIETGLMVGLSHRRSDGRYGSEYLKRVMIAFENDMDACYTFNENNFWINGSFP